LGHWLAYPTIARRANGKFKAAMKAFDRIIVVDWSARSSLSPQRPSADAIWIAEVGLGGVESRYIRGRSLAMAALNARFSVALDAGERLLVGFDFPFGYPVGFADQVAGEANALAVWRMLAQQIEDGDDNRNNRFPVAAKLNARFPGTGPFWGCPQSQHYAGLPHKGTAREGHGLPERRLVETHIRSTQPCWKLFTTGSVGSQALLGIARLEQLRRRWGETLSVWPFEAGETPIVLAEIYPSLLNLQVDAALRKRPEAIKDDVQVRLLALALTQLQRQGLLGAGLCAAKGPDLMQEGWILGVGVEDAVRAAAKDKSAVLFA